MEKKIKRYHRRKLGIIFGIVFVLLAAAGITWQRINAQVAADAVRPMFSFTGAKGWWQGATNETSMALFNYDKVSKSGGECFVSVEYRTGTINVNNELERTYNKLTGAHYQVTQLGVKKMTVQSPSGNQSYDIHQSSVVSPAGNSQLMGGQEYGFVQLSGGYLYIIGFCNTPDQLPETYPALAAMKFDAKN